MKTVLVLVLTSIMIVSLPVAAKKDDGHGNPHAQDDARSQGGKPAKGSKSRESGDSASISIAADITIGGARDLARDVGIRPGSYQALPPGMRNRLAKGKALPPGIAKKQVPPALLSRLPVHPGHEWLVIGVDLVLVNARTRVSVDILPGVF